MLSARSRVQFDRLLDEVLAEMPGHLHDLLAEVPLVVDDEPTNELLADLSMTDPTELCGLHQGIALTERNIEDIVHLPDTIMLFRRGIIELARSEDGRIRRAELREQIRITLLHEIGHHFGLDEDQLDKLGYG